MLTREKQIAEIERLLSVWDRKIARAFLEGVRVVQSDLSLASIERALRENSATNAIYVLRQTVEAAGFASFARTLTDAMIAGGDYGAKLAAANRVEFGFNITESKIARFLEEYRATRIRQIKAEMIETISQIIYREAGAGKNPNSTARLIRQNLGLTAFQEGHVANYRRFLEEAPARRSIEAALKEYTLRDKRFDANVIRAIKDGTEINRAKIDKMVEAYRRRYLLRRSENIARTESAAMTQTGNHEYWRVLTESGIVSPDEIKRKWIFTRDTRTRHAHRTIPELNPDGVGLNEPFKSSLGLIRFPGDPSASAANRINCRCHVFIRIDRK